MEDSIKILQLYPDELNVYGDDGNILALKKRLEWRGFKAEIIKHNVNDDLNVVPDIIVSGGGQDSNQDNIKNDFLRIALKLKNFIENSTPTLLICGSYQLFGKYFQTQEGKKIEGINILDIYTIAGKKRLIGNTVFQTEIAGEIIGYENHSGLTYLGENVKPLGVISKGGGNNGKDNTEGVIYKNLIGTYAHGPVLPKNPRLADFLIEKALQKKLGSDFRLSELNDDIENQAHLQSSNRPR